MRRLAAALSLAVVAVATTAYAAPDLVAQSRVEQRDHLRKDIRPAVASAGIPTTRTGPAKCIGGKAAGFSCNGVDLLSFLPLSEMGGADPVVDALGGGASDLWGWTDSTTEDEYVLMGKTNGTAFYRITDPTNPVFLGVLPNPSPGQLIWHDMKVYKDHAFIVSESVAHGMQVFDLTRLRALKGATALTPDLNYPLGFSAHNIAVNEETGFVYLVGGNNGLAAPDQCRSGLHMVDVRNPKVPVFAGCHALGEGKGTAGSIVGVEGLSSYIHDTHCVVYRGPDKDHTGKELCFNSSEDHFSVVDVTNKLLPTQISRTPYDNVKYAHQGWLTDDQATFLMGDELDEGTGPGLQKKTRTLVFDVTDLDAPTTKPSYAGRTAAIDHNMYVRDGLVYQSNYAAGLQILGTGKPTPSGLEEVASFDSFPEHDKPEFVGSWSNYPYFASGTVAWSGIDDGLFLGKVQQDVLAKHAKVTTLKK